jgi:SRSO17 transposase
VETTKDRAVAAGHSVDPAGWQAVFDDVMDRVAGRFARVEPRRTARVFVSGLLSDVKSKTCWGLAEQAGYARPDAMQRLLRTARWDADAVRDDVRGFVVARLAHPDAVLVVDETGDLKKGTHSVGVQRQYTGTAGRIENAQVGVFLAYASPRGRALADRRLYLPASWTDDPDRCTAAGVPSGTVFATKPRLAGDMIEDALDGGVAAGWVAGDEVYGNDPVLRARLQARGLGYVLAVSCDHRVPIDGGKVRVRADQLTDGLPASAWQPMSAGAGSKGPRFYDWAWLDLTTAGGQPGHSMLIRRNPTTGELAFYRCWTPARRHWPPSCGSPAHDGWSRRRSKPPKAKSVWMNTRSGSGLAGSVSPSWPCSPWPSSPPAPNSTHPPRRLTLTTTPVTTTGRFP